MIALMKELNMNQEHPRRRRFPINVRGSYAGEGTESGSARCFLQIGRTQIAVDVPAHVLRRYRRGGQEGIVLHLPNERVVPIEARSVLSESERRMAREWYNEMQDFDRF